MRRRRTAAACSHRAVVVKKSVIPVALLALAGYLAWRRGFSFIDMASPRADRVLVDTLRRRFGEPTANRPL